MDANGIRQTGVPSRRRGRGILSVLLVLLLVIGLVGTFALYKVEQATSAPIRASDRFLYAMLDKNIDSAYAMTSETFQAATSREEFGQVAAIANKELKKNSLKVQTGEIEEDELIKKALLTYFISGNDQEYELKITVIQHLDDNKGQWLVHAVSNSKRSL